MIKAIYVLRISFPIYGLRLDSHLAGSFLLPSPLGPRHKCTLSTLQRKHLHTELIPVLLRAHTEQHLKNLLQTWILNASSPGNLTTPIYWRNIRYVPDNLCHNKHPLHFLFSRVFSACLFLMAPVMMAFTPASMCTPLKTLNDSLSHRRRYMKHNFPINYSIRVHHKEIFKLANISKMNLKVEGLDELVLQRLWFQVNQGILKKIIRVLPERHPSRPYTAELERRFRDAEGVFVQSHPAEVRVHIFAPQNQFSN
ncbi:hypothetical protein AMECASPLE_014528 [Ameca splendens]|uniref:Interleukin 34 n=1 Tax=Ameca splendens TaxID=208324 RepID=A0ABV0YPT0_9TELE